MTLPAQLRAIADRIEAATALKRAALDDLAGIAHYAVTVLGATMPDGSSIEPDSAAVLDAAEDQPAEAEAAPGFPGHPDASPAPIAKRAESGRPVKAATGGLPVRTAPPATAPRRGPRPGALRPCPDCEKSFDTPQGLSLHRRRVHGYQPWVPKPQGTKRPEPVMRKGVEQWVCARCPEAFLTREARNLHQSMHPPIPTSAPLRTIGRGGLGE